jgi:hypothetical protein
MKPPRETRFIFRHSAGRACGSFSARANPSGPTRISMPLRPLIEHAILPSTMNERPPIIVFSMTSRRPDRTLRTRSAVCSS